jgi:hypothetical protein
MLGQVNQVMVRANQESQLLDTICRILVEDSGYRMAWIDFAEQDDAKSVRPVAQAGFEAGYLDAVNITWADAKRGVVPPASQFAPANRR